MLSVPPDVICHQKKKANKEKQKWVLQEGKAETGCRHNISCLCFRGARDNSGFKGQQKPLSNTMQHSDSLKMHIWMLNPLFKRDGGKRKQTKSIEFQSPTGGDHTAQSPHLTKLLVLKAFDYLGIVYLHYRLIMPRIRKQQSRFCVRSAEVQQGLLGLEQRHAEAQSHFRVGTTPELQNLPRTWNAVGLRGFSHLCSIPELLSPQGHKKFYTRRNFCIPLLSTLPTYPAVPGLFTPTTGFASAKRGRHTQVYYHIHELKSWSKYIN